MHTRDSAYSRELFARRAYDPTHGLPRTSMTNPADDTVSMVRSSSTTNLIRAFGGHILVSV